jgi:LmbE family N-acetylglucosaminyl deacetylase
MGHILAIGGHCGDMEFTCGAVLLKHAKRGDQITLLHMTPGEKGHATMSPEEYAFQKKKEALDAAEALGGKALFLPYGDGELPVSDEVKYQIADIIREIKPTTIITHWKNSIHKDHANTHLNVVDAVFYAAISGIKRPLPAHGVKGIYYAENWEDPYDFQPYVYVDVSEVFDEWLEAASKYQLFAGGVSKFPFKEYYKSLAVIRGSQCGAKYAVAMDIEPMGKKRIMDFLP